MNGWKMTLTWHYGYSHGGVEKKLKKSCCDIIATKLQWIALEWNHILHILQLM